ncbi:MAG: EamA family transporter [Candidatus Competibacteraceae bacterium]
MNPIDLALALLANTAWAFNFIAGKAGVEHFPPLLFTALRFSLLLVLLIPFLRWIPGQMKGVLSLGVILGIFHFGLIFAGLAAAGDVSSIAIAAQLYVPFSALLAVVFLHETLGWRRILGIGCAFCGVVVIGFDPIVFNHPDALFFTVAAALVMAIATIMMRRLQGVSVFTLQAWIALIATPGMIVLSSLLESHQWTVLQSATWLDYAMPAYSAIGASLVGHGIVYYLLGRYPVSVTAPLMLLAPVLAVFFGVVVWGDTLTWKLLLGGTLTLTGVAVITIRAPRQVLALDSKPARP